MQIETFKGGYDNNFSYIIYDASQNVAAVIDCFDDKLAREFLKKNNLTLKYIISTHNHFDHVAANKELLLHTNAKLVMYKSNNCDIKVDEGDELSLGNSKLKILYTPGHTMDCICILADDKYLFTGDTLFVGTIGGIFCCGGEDFFGRTLKRLMALDDNIIIYSGHDYGKTPTSTIAHERKTNRKVLMYIKDD